MADVWVLKHVMGMAEVKVFDNETAAKTQFDIICKAVRCRPRQTKEVHDRPVRPVYEYIPGRLDITGPIIGQYFFVNQKEFIEYRKQKLLTSV